MEQGEIQALIERLWDFRTRSTAHRRIVAHGREAVGPLLEALENEQQEGARWTILNCLGELGAEQAVPTIAPYLDDPDYQTVAHDALVKITGRDLGLMPEPWLRAVSTGAAEEVERARGELPDRKLLELSLQGSGAELREEAEDRWAVDLPVGEGARREISVVFGSTDHEGSPLVILYSNCGPADPEHYETVLRQNLRMPYGAVALREIGGKPHFVMFNTILRKALSPTELRKSITTVGERARRVEQTLGA